ncbi:MAG: metal ABC transporter ATP-binding protein [Chloroflexota bacterium]|nr:metal ABC transporter ATP-binding protein [Chloroflexota bacterium]
MARVTDAATDRFSTAPVPPSGRAPRAGTHAVELRGVAGGYGRRIALDGVNLTVPTGTLTAVVGPNGGGKSTLLKLLLGLIEPWDGSVRVFGRAPRAVRRRIGYVPQTGSGDWRFPATVGEVVMMGRNGRIGLFRRPGAADRAAVRAALDRVGMLARIDEQVSELSGGQQQRAFFARALVQEPELLLLDEPLAGVDALTEQDIYRLLRELVERGVSVLFTTHNLSSVAEQFDLAVFVNRSVVAAGPPGVVFNEANLRATYGPRMALVKIGQRFFAIDVGDHADRPGVGDS